MQADFGGISIGCSGRHLEIEKQWRVGARQKVYQAWEGERKIGEGGGEGKEKSQSAANPKWRQDTRKIER